MHHSMRTPNKRGGFTLVELLVVIAIIGILVGMLLPAVQYVRESARRTQCSNNSRQIGLAVLNYEAAFGRFPPGWSTSDPTDALASPGWGWSAHILDFLEQKNVADRIDMKTAIDDPSHVDIIQTSLPIFLCSSDPSPDLVNLGAHVDHGSHLLLTLTQGHGHEEFVAGRSNYSGVFGSTEIEDDPLEGNGIFFANSRIKISDVRDGTSNTILIGERRNDIGAVSWVGVVADIDEPMARIVGVTDHAPNNRHAHFEDFRSFHPQGINVTMADGSTHFVGNGISPSVFQALGTRAGGEAATIDD